MTSRRTGHTFSRVVRLDPAVRFACCDSCGKLDHIRPLYDELVCDSCRQTILLENSWDWPDDAA